MIENKNKSETVHNEFEEKRKKYREWLEKTPPIFDENIGYEMKECQGCYCKLFADSHYDFCSGCLGCDSRDCPWGCCDCYSDGSRGWRGSNGKIAKGTYQGKEKKLSFAQKQRLHWEQVIQNAWDIIEEIKDYEEPDHKMGTAKIVENIKRWSEQRKKRELESCSIEELEKEIERKKSLPPQTEKKTKLKKAICNFCRKGFNPAPNKDLANDYLGESQGKIFLACDNCQKKGFKSKDIK